MRFLHALAWCLTAMLFLGAGPTDALARVWSFSPHSVQISDGGTAGTDDSSVNPEPAASEKKNIGKAVMFSLIIPGTGQLYSGSWPWALPWIAVEVAGWAMFAKYHGDGQDKTDAFEAYAGPRDDPNHFNVDAYLLREYQVATNPQFTTTTYTNTLTAWKEEPWTVRLDYLPAPYTHDVLTLDMQQYFEMIGKYLLQFGYGWADTYDPDNNTVDLEDGGLGNNIWSHPAAGLQPDNTSTVGFDGLSPMFLHYRDMRGEANDLLNSGNTAMEIVLVNHILSAVHAAFLTRIHNKHLAATPMGQMKLDYETKYADFSRIRSLRLSIPMDGFLR